MNKTSRSTAGFALRPLALALVLGGSLTSAFATNGMNMEGYGPISTAMGGASQSFDNGTAAMAQNPATLGLMAEGARLDVALGVLGPKITASMPGMPAADSGGTSYVMPALGYVRRSGSLTYGVGMFSQGGMGTEYGANSFLAAGSGEPVRSELGVGKVIIPVAYQATPALTLGATFDFMWAGMDLLMAASGAQLGSLVTSASGPLAGALGPLAGAPWARINFSDSDKNTGAAKSTGYSAKLGGVYKVSNDVSVGGSYQFKSKLDDMKTAAGSASMTAAGGFADTGTITVIDFQWPSVLAVGASWQASPALMVAADLKSIGWADAMKSFRMRYDSLGMGGSVSFTMPQNWKDQTVLSLGMAWKANDKLVWRAGVNIADNPIPEDMVNPLFPATIKSHITAGLGYEVTKNDAINVALTMAPKVSVTNASGVTTEHAQTNVQLMYSRRF
jgi:long-chain fatty acid transport protein